MGRLCPYLSRFRFSYCLPLIVSLIRVSWIPIWISRRPSNYIASCCWRYGRSLSLSSYSIRKEHQCRNRDTSSPKMIFSYWITVNFFTIIITIWFSHYLTSRFPFLEVPKKYPPLKYFRYLRKGYVYFIPILVKRQIPRQYYYILFSQIWTAKRELFSSLVETHFRRKWSKSSHNKTHSIKVFQDPDIMRFLI